VTYSSSGNATKKEPTDGWSSQILRDIFNNTIPGSPTSLLNGSTPDAPTSLSKGYPHTGKIIGATLGGILGLGIMLYLLYTLRWKAQERKNGNSGASYTEFQSRQPSASPPRLKCFRISGIPTNYNQNKLVDILRASYLSHTFKHDQLSLFGSCYDDTKTALLNLDDCAENMQLCGYLQVQDSGDSRKILEIDTHFYNLTLLNDPVGEVLAELVFA